MNKKTILFLDALSLKEGGEEMAQLARRHMQALFLETLHMSWPVDQVIWVTAEAEELKANMQTCWDRIGSMTRPIQGLELINQIEQLHSAWQKLHEQAQKQMYTAGSVDMKRLHVVRRSEEASFRSWFLELVQIQLYRVLVLGGAERFRKMAKLRDESAEALIDYYRRQILPALDMLTREQLSGVWSVSWRRNSAFGGQITLPGCRLAPPQGKNCDILPGHYRIIRQSGETIYEGRGLLTNITPGTVLRAQREGFLSENELRADALLWMSEMDMSMEPRAILRTTVQKGLYALEPYDYFSKFSFVCGMIQLKERKRNRVCPLCGGVMSRTELGCAGCREVMVHA